jgi:hypothetical protein
MYPVGDCSASLFTLAGPEARHRIPSAPTRVPQLLTAGFPSGFVRHPSVRFWLGIDFPAPAASATNPIVAWIGLDSPDQKHDVYLQATGSTEVEHLVVEQKPEALYAWLAELRRRFPHGPIAIAREQSRGSLFYGLMNYEFLRLYPIPPQALADYRKALHPSGSKDDPVDAELLRKHPQHFRPWVADDVETRQLTLLNEHRCRPVDARTALTNRLTTLLKGYLAEALRWAEDLRTPLARDFLAQFPSLERAQQASRLEVLKVYRAHTRRPP